ncbi:MAG: hypothetical protein JRN62_04010 [Nitrososphaerota archaeon]|jgi:hypothetical protein|nr:hypothetical protein [Nitrososphaerota archaeon]MDG6948768.1 hypothetical protein [Nitrososphaerota archaeon]
MRDVVVFGPPGSGKSVFIKRYLLPALIDRKAKPEVCDFFEAIRQGSRAAPTRVSGAAGPNYNFDQDAIANGLGKVYARMEQSGDADHPIIYETATDRTFETRIPRTIKTKIPRSRRPFLVFMNTPKAICIANNKVRRSHCVPDHVLRGYLMYDQFMVMAVGSAAGVPLIMVNELSHDYLTRMAGAIAEKMLS